MNLGVELKTVSLVSLLLYLTSLHAILAMLSGGGIYRSFWFGCFTWAVFLFPETQLLISVVVFP